ncbi:MAG: hypothetical protein ACXVJN_17990 [Mucilaginibacter sp.]
MMKRILFIVATIFLTQICMGQVDTSKKEVYSKEFKWRISIPAGFANISPDQYAKLQQKGTDMIEKAYNGKVENHTTLIFAFKSDQLHYIESNYQPFDPAIDGNFLTVGKAVDDIVYGTFKKQVPEGTKIDTAITTEVIDNLKFQRFEMKISVNNVLLTLLMYNRLFDKKELTITIFYVDKVKGDQLLAALRNSKFNKE